MLFVWKGCNRWRDGDQMHHPVMVFALLKDHGLFGIASQPEQHLQRLGAPFAVDIPRCGTE